MLTFATVFAKYSLLSVQQKIYSWFGIFTSSLGCGEIKSLKAWFDLIFCWEIIKYSCLVSQVGLKNNCTFCGVFRRQALDRGAMQVNLNKYNLICFIILFKNESFISCCTALKKNLTFIFEIKEEMLFRFCILSFFYICFWNISRICFLLSLGS